MKRTVVYGSVRTGDCSQRVPLQGRHDCSLTDGCVTGTQKLYGRERTGYTRSILTLCDNGSLLVMVQYCANMLAIFVPNGSSFLTIQDRT